MHAQLDILGKQCSASTQNGQSIETALGRIFPNHKEESRVQKIRRTMGAEICVLSDEEIVNYITEFQYLIDGWLDEYEEKAFNKTLSRLRKEGLG